MERRTHTQKQRNSEKQTTTHFIRKKVLVQSDFCKENWEISEVIYMINKSKVWINTNSTANIINFRKDNTARQTIEFVQFYPTKMSPFSIHSWIFETL